MSTTLLIIKNSFFSSSVHVKGFFINPLILKRWRGVMMMMMMVQSCQSIHNAPPPLSPAPPLPDQQQSLKQKRQNFFPSFCRSVVLDSFYFYFCFLPPPLLHSHTPLYSVHKREQHTHTPTHKQFVVNNKLSVLIQCVCTGGGGGRGYITVLSWRGEGGGVIIFSVQQNFFVLFKIESIFSCMYFCNFTLFEQARKPRPIQHIPPSHWI